MHNFTSPENKKIKYYYKIFTDFHNCFKKDKILRVIFYKYFIPLLNKNRLVDEKFIKDYNNNQKVIRSFYT